MPKFNKKYVIPMAAVAILAAGAYGVAQVSAASDSTSPRESLVQKIADTFHLDKTKVQAVFDQQRQENQADREQKYEDRLSKAVTAGKLTSAQKDAVLAEHKKLQAELDAAMSDTDKTARRTAMDKVRTEAQDWAKTNNIGAQWLMMGGPMGGPGGHRGMMRDHDGDADDTPTSSPAPAVTPGA